MNRIAEIKDAARRAWRYASGTRKGSNARGDAILACASAYARARYVTGHSTDVGTVPARLSEALWRMLIKLTYHEKVGDLPYSSSIHSLPWAGAGEGAP